MALAAGPDRQVGRLVIRNIGLMLSGALEAPVLDADTIVAESGRIVAVGKRADVDVGEARVVIDAHGCAVAPGLIDSHVHPVFGDWTPRQGQFGWIDSFLHGGVTTMVSAGEVHLPGRPRDIVGVKALAVVAQRCYDAFRPGGVKVLAGAPVIEQGMVESDFVEMAAAGSGCWAKSGLAV
jgi:enamidase